MTGLMNTPCTSGLLGVAGEVGDEHLERQADLRRRQAQALVLVHQLEHRLGDAAHLGVDGGQRLRLVAQGRVRVVHDLQGRRYDVHGRVRRSGTDSSIITGAWRFTKSGHPAARFQYPTRSSATASRLVTASAVIHAGTQRRWP